MSQFETEIFEVNKVINFYTLSLLAVLVLYRCIWPAPPTSGASKVVVFLLGLLQFNYLWMLCLFMYNWTCMRKYEYLAIYITHLMNLDVDFIFLT